jgi:AhpD family alkylhydroperoxidase
MLCSCHAGRYAYYEVAMPRLPYTKLAPEAYARLQSLGHYLSTGTALEPVLLGLVYLRASTLNGCSFCKGMHTAELLHHHEPQTRIDAVADWQSSNAFTPRERAALAWTDLVTRIDDCQMVAGHEIPTEAFDAAHKFFSDKDLVDLTFAIASINAWNRLGIAFATEWNPKKHEAVLAAKVE